MVELPEAIVIARQISTELRGKRISMAMRGNSPHRFAFYNRPAEEYAAILPGRTIGQASDYGGCLLVYTEPDYLLQLGGGGERILYHTDASSLPKKHHLLLGFDDGTYLSVTVQGWGYAQLWRKDDDGSPLGKEGVHPLGEAFTPEYFESLFKQLPPGDPRMIKYFIISQPGVGGVGNGYLQDILFRAKIGPRRRAHSLDAVERLRLYGEIRDVLALAVDSGGRDSERDLHNRPGRYVRMMDSRTAGKPCPKCGTVIEKIFLLGGASYFCPKCQV